MKRLLVTIRRAQIMVSKMPALLLLGCGLALACIAPSGLQCTYINEDYQDCAGFIDTCLKNSQQYCFKDDMCTAMPNFPYGYYCWECPGPASECSCPNVGGTIGVETTFGLGDDMTGCRKGNRCGPWECFCQFNSAYMILQLYPCSPCAPCP